MRDRRLSESILALLLFSIPVMGEGARAAGMTLIMLAAALASFEHGRRVASLASATGWLTTRSASVLCVALAVIVAASWYLSREAAWFLIGGSLMLGAAAVGVRRALREGTGQTPTRSSAAPPQSG